MSGQHTKTGKKLFVSDAHLGGFDKTLNRKIELELIHLIDFCENNDFDMYILGDLFDYWMEYPNHRPELGEELLERFEKYNRNTGSTLYITGNHDNWTNGYFKTVGFKIEKNHHFVNLDGKKAMLLHGDGLDDPSFNLPRPLFHRILRNPNFVKLYQSVLSPDTGLDIMMKFSRLARSREVTEAEKNLNNWARKQLESSDTDFILCGHDHSPRRLNFDFGTFINLGTFYQHKSVAVYNNSELTLVSWNDEARQLTPTPNT
ncbi:hypothetical protein G3570_08720 [Balneolaceae bacterium YR4-1]|uniref:Calcineurin-like phosphoesterase domain-containing protein n=1 Tax=Halalkalibaculum roseum TaxID=2709311 RepID=A0A6M1SZS7_9BACT|nr:metallophosphoesterase [Halalkalibaculum roseum]NGP76714.1 hypothetical protein [Halalkalibaculum roseum]